MRRKSVSVRKRSSATLFGVPLWETAFGPDEERGESRGHAMAIVAVGDVATGVVAIGGIARGFIAIGGVAWGLIALGGLGLGLVALGGLAVGGLALGGGAIGGVAVGGGAVGVYAIGGGAVGEHVIDAVRKDPQAVKFFETWLPWLLGAFVALDKRPRQAMGSRSSAGS